MFHWTNFLNLQICHAGLITCTLHRNRPFYSVFDLGRLKTAIGTGPPPFSVPSGASSSSEISAAAEALSSLRLHYEEALVRLYSCQSNAISVMRDPSKNTADFWGNLRQGLADARSATEALNCDNKLWRKAEDLVESNANGDDRSGADLSLGVPSSEAHSGVPMFTARTLLAICTFDRILTSPYLPRPLKPSCRYLSSPGSRGGVDLPGSLERRRPLRVRGWKLRRGNEGNIANYG